MTKKIYIGQGIFLLAIFLFFGFLIASVSGGGEFTPTLIPTPTPPPQYGSIYAYTDPSGAYVYLDGAYKGQSPITIYKVPAGTHTVKFTKSGYKDCVKTVTVYPNQQTSVYCSLNPYCCCCCCCCCYWPLDPSSKNISTGDNALVGDKASLNGCCGINSYSSSNNASIGDKALIGDKARPNWCCCCCCCWPCKCCYCPCKCLLL
ncbi:MAG: PEGA domain-containing protein [Candidatus Altarchaeaceae archaeon]